MADEDLGTCLAEGCDAPATVTDSEGDGFCAGHLPEVTADERCRSCETALDDIDAWRAGRRETPGSPATGERYALRMREECKTLRARILACDCPGGAATRRYFRDGGL